MKKQKLDFLCTSAKRGQRPEVLPKGSPPPPIKAPHWKNPGLSEKLGSKHLKWQLRKEQKHAFNLAFSFIQV